MLPILCNDIFELNLNHMQFEDIDTGISVIVSLFGGGGGIFFDECVYTICFNRNIYTDALHILGIRVGTERVFLRLQKKLI